MIQKLQTNEKIFSTDWEWKQLSFKSGLLANQSDGSIVINLWDTTLLITAVLNRNPDPDKDFMPLTIDFRESFYAGGKIWWVVYTRREWRPSETVILLSRMTDRPIRPMFPEWMINDVIITITPLSVDKENSPWVISIIWTSLAIMLAGIQFEWPVWAVRVWYKDWNFIVNPTYQQIEEWMLDLLIAGSHDTITMVECWAQEVNEEILMQAFEIAQTEIKKICEWQNEFLKQFEIQKKEIKTNKPDIETKTFIKQFFTKDKIDSIYPCGKKIFDEFYNKMVKEVLEQAKDKIEDETLENFTVSKIKIWVFKVMKEYIRANILEKKQRIDGRNLDQVRPLFCNVWIVPKVHGTGLFQRWETQVLAITTLGAPGDVLLVDNMEVDETEHRFIHHYNMLPFANNEARSRRWAGRREIWHWKLAEKALEKVLPTKESFPYAIRVVSEVLSSNGSTSMASVCAGCLSLMDAWVPIIKPVSWIAMGLISDEKLNYEILTDIQWLEDFVWDMDFKVAGTKDGITALQMDMKIKWLTLDIVKTAIQRANIWRAEILDFMLLTLDKPREQTNPNAPKIITIKVEPWQVKDVIGPWWSIINEIIRQTWVKIDFLEDGTCFITAKNRESADKALSIIKTIIWTPQEWDTIEWTICRIESYWVFVNLSKNKQWLCHVKNLSDGYISDPKTLFKEWDKITVKIIWIDKDGKIQLKKIA